MTDPFGPWQPGKRTGNDSGTASPEDLKQARESLRDRPSEFQLEEPESKSQFFRKMKRTTNKPFEFGG